MVHESLGRCQRQISKGFQGYAVQLQNWPSGNQRTVNKALRGPLKACKHGSLSMVFLLEHSGWRSTDQRLLADIPWCLMSPLGFHWLANERLGQRHWTDKNKVTCLASDVENLFSLQLSLETSWILFSNNTLNLTLSTVSDPHILKCHDKPTDTHSHTPYYTYIPHVYSQQCPLHHQLQNIMNQIFNKLADVITKNLAWHHALLAEYVPLKYHTISLTLLSEAPK